MLTGKLLGLLVSSHLYDQCFLIIQVYVMLLAKNVGLFNDVEL
jgi:hypothetical protein